MTETNAPDYGGFERADLARILAVAAAAAAIWFRVWEPFRSVSVIGVAMTLVGGWPIFHAAIEDVRQRRMTMELSMTIALLAALAIGEFFTALVITLFVLVAEVLEGLTVARGRHAIEHLLEFLPKTAWVRRHGTIVVVHAAELRVADEVLVRPGEKIPVDGAVIDGASAVDQAAITGESMPVDKVPGSMVFAGTLNHTGALVVRAERLGHDTTFGRIIEAVERAERVRAPIQRLADRLSAYVVYFAFAAAFFTFGLTQDIRATISVIIVAGACGIAAGTPLAILGAIGRAASRGALVRGGVYLEALSTVNTVVLDKTGTLTTGRPEVIEVLPRSGASANDVLASAASAELRSEHPIAGAIVRAAEARGVAVIEPDGFLYTPGLGVDARVGGSRVLVGSARLLHQNGVFDPAPRATRTAHGIEVLVVRGGRVLGTIVMADRLRGEAARAVLALRAMDIRTVLLSGDDKPVADAIGREAGVDEVVAGALPEAKQLFVRNLVASGRRVAMVGDGINDAPAIVEATVGVAMGSGTDVARESAGVVLLRNDLMPLVEAIRTARRARGIIWANFVGTIGVDLVGMGLAAGGHLNPLLAAFIHVASELTFILNSARLIPRGRPTEDRGPTMEPQMAMMSGAIALACVVVGLPAFAQSEYRNTDSGRPLRIEDAESIEFRALEFQFAPFRLERPRAGIDRWQFEPRLSYGILPRTELELRAPIVYREPGAYSRGGLAGLGVGMQRNFNDETPSLPSFALSGEYVIPAGGASTNPGNWVIRGAATRTFTPGRLHFNAAYGTYNLIVYPSGAGTPGCQNCGITRIPINDGPCEVLPEDVGILAAESPARSPQIVPAPPDGTALATVRQGRRLLLGLAGDHTFPLWSTMFAADLFVERFSLSTSPADWTAEVGARHQVTPRVIFDVGVGRRFTGASPSWIGTVGTSYSFSAGAIGLHGNCP